MPEEKVLVTGACGEIGQALIQSLHEKGNKEIISLDLKPLPDHLKGLSRHIEGDLLNKKLINSLESNHTFGEIYHLAAVLSTHAESNPLLAHQVNTCITIDLLEMAIRQSQAGNLPVKFLFPSSIAVYGIPDLETKLSHPPIKEHQFTNPITMYGCSKLYCENVGVYYSDHYQQLSSELPTRIDFRAIRFPGIISAFTIPSGGTSDFGPEMIHSAAQGKDYACFVRKDVGIPFMMMTDAVRAITKLAEASPDQLNQRIYNITSFSYTAADFKSMTESCFPGAAIQYKPDPKRQAIVDSWPADIDDTPARNDWGWKPRFEIEEDWQSYLLENITRHYS
jgi:nucleoside-diphosphate-sugar epimerase